MSARVAGADRVAEAAGMDRHRLGMLVFISSEATFFLFLVIVYIAYQGDNVQGPGPHAALDVGRTAVFSACLFLSSATVALAGRELDRGRLDRFCIWLGGTIVLGLTFLAGQGWEYSDLFAHHVTPARNLFACSFFVLTGFHVLHVLIGVTLLCIVLGLAFAGLLRRRQRQAVESIFYYWHFVDAVWVVIFSTVYLWSAH